MALPKNNNILLINPPIADFYQTKIRQEPLGLAYLAAVLTEAGFQVTLLDTLATAKKASIPLPPTFQDLKCFYPPADLSPFKLFTNYFHFGLDWETITGRIQQSHPAFIGISANFSPYFDAVLTVAQICKNFFPQVPVVVGGHHVTATPVETLRHTAIDYVISGEGEYTLRALAQYHFQSQPEKICQLPGLAWRKGSVIHVNPPAAPIDSLDLLPFPPAPAAPRLKMLISSRGCPQGCEFCSIKQVMGSRLRFRSVENVIQEIQYWVHQGIGHFDFEDDNLACAPERAKILLRQIMHRFGPRRLKFSAMNGLSADYLDVEFLELLSEAGFEWLNLPLVTGDSHLQRRLERHQSREHFYRIVELAAQFDLKVVG
ncbi:cobalamin-dependent protein, partial [candidate division KSB1 bacterium]|nr:cobalamin-dependent protein [candidate division KSB1 bacterium]